MRGFLFFCFFVFLFEAHAQSFSYKGIVLDEKGNALAFATIALLDPSDSTLALYAVSNSNGNFEVKNIKAGSYILQASFLGYKTKYRAVKFPGEDPESLHSILMEPSQVDLPAAQVEAERIPLLIRGDTVEYNASSYKTGADAVAEDLLKKLPGVSVDRNGNIKAQGEDVKKVTVDGKEFFGNDPKVATKNLPADAVSKVQVYDTKSDQAELTGINDGKRDKTINLQLKDDKKKAWFGEIQAGAGTEEHFQSGAKAYRFTPEKQIAFLGMLNNINKFGFSFSDYLDFSGGFRGGEGFKISTGNNDFPIDFGEVQKGLITSGAIGANYTTEKRKGNRLNVSYLANGINKKMNRDDNSENFTGDETFYSRQNSFDNERNRAHRVNLGWKNKIDTLRTLNVSGQASLSSNSIYNSTSVFNSSAVDVVSDQHSENNGSGNSFLADLHSSYLKKLQSSWKLFSFEANGNFRHTLSKNEMQSLTGFYFPPSQHSLNQFQHNNNDYLNIDFEGGITRKIGGISYLEGKLSGGMQNETYSREQGLVPDSDGLIDSLSGELNKNFQWLEPAIAFRSLSEKSQLTLSVGAYVSDMWNRLDDGRRNDFQKIYLLPSVTWEKQYRAGRRLRLVYDASVLSPEAADLFPLTNYYNPINQVTGSQKLIPELHHDVRFHWNIFDQFSFTSFFAGMRFSYTKDKISWSKTIDDNLVQRTSLINVPEDYSAALNAEFSTPIRKLGINLTLNAEERWNQTNTFVDAKLNRNSGFSHIAGLSVDNRKKDKWDASAGVTMTFSNSLYTLTGSMKNKYIRADLFTDCNFTPTERWQFSLKADVSHYYGEAFNDNVKVPLLQADASYSFLKNKRGTLILSGFDLLNRNSGVERTSEYNYLLERRTDIIQRYVMLSFKYKLNKFNSDNKVDVKVNGR